jgi:hypothetical protein
MAHDMTPAAARDALVSAATASHNLRTRARWSSTKLAVFGVGIGLVTATVGLVDSKLLGAAVFAGWGMLAGGMSLWERRRLAHLAGTSERIRPYWMAGFAFYGVAVATASGETSGDLAHWLPAGVIVSLPMLIGAWRERRA